MKSNLMASRVHEIITRKVDSYLPMDSESVLDPSYENLPASIIKNWREENAP
jgi:hypothetical protein